MEGDPARQSLSDLESELVRGGRADSSELALESDRLTGLRAVVHAIDPDGVVRDEPLGFDDDGLADPLDILDPVQTGGQLLDGPQPRGSLADRAVQPGIGHGDRHLAGEGRAQVQLVGRPVVWPAVIQDQQPHRLVTEHERDEVDPLEPAPGLDLGELRGRRGIVHDDGTALAHGSQPDSRLVTGQGAHGVDQLLGQLVVRRQPQGMAAGVHQPQRRCIGSEQRSGRGEDVSKDLVQLEAGARLGHHAAERDRSGLGGPDGVVQGASRRGPRPRRP